MDNNNTLLNVISKTSNTTITVESINTIKTGLEYIYDITILVSDKETLSKFMGEVETLPNITKVERLIK